MQYLISLLITIIIVIIYIQTPFKVYGKGKTKQYIKEHRFTFIVYFVLRLLVTFTMIRSIYQENYFNAFLCVLTLILFIMPMALENTLKIELPSIFEIIILLFIFSAEILGEINSFYTLHNGWDTILHTMNGFLCAAIGFALFDMLNRELSDKIKLSPFYLSLMAFCFSMTIGVLWEFIEFGVDYFFVVDMQKDFVINSFGSVYFDENSLNNVVRVKDILSTVITTKDGSIYTIENGYLDIGIIDTMKDLLVNFIGALFFSISGYFLKKYESRLNIARLFSIKVIDENNTDK